MNHIMIQRWNEVVKPGDVVYHLGDFAFFKKRDIDKVKELLQTLNGVKYLVIGNHDKNKETMLDVGFAEVYEKELVIDTEETKLFLSHRRTRNLPTINVSVEIWNYYPIPLPTSVKQPLHLCGHVHNLWTMNSSSSLDATSIWNKVESKSKGRMVENKTWMNTKNRNTI